MSTETRPSIAEMRTPISETRSSFIDGYQVELGAMVKRLQCEPKSAELILAQRKVQEAIFWLTQVR